MEINYIGTYCEILLNYYSDYCFTYIDKMRFKISATVRINQDLICHSNLSDYLFLNGTHNANSASKWQKRK